MQVDQEEDVPTMATSTGCALVDSSLPKVLWRRIADFVSPTDLLALASTCSTLHKLLNLSSLNTPYEYFPKGKFRNGRGVSRSVPETISKIPVIFGKDCHSIRMTSNWTIEAVGRHKCPTFHVAIVEVLSQEKKDVEGSTCATPPHTIVNTRGERARVLSQSVSPISAGCLDYCMDMTINCPPSSRLDDLDSVKGSIYIWCHFQDATFGYGVWPRSFTIQRVLVWDDENRTKRKVHKKCMDTHLFFSGAENEGDTTDAIFDCEFDVSEDYHSRSFPFLGRLFSTSLSYCCVESRERNDVRDFLLKCCQEADEEMSATSDSCGEASDDGILLTPRVHLSLHLVKELFLQLIQVGLGLDRSTALSTTNDKVCNLITVNERQVDMERTVLPELKLQQHVRKWNYSEDTAEEGTEISPLVVARIPVVEPTYHLKPSSFRIGGDWDTKTNSSLVGKNASNLKTLPSVSASNQKTLPSVSVFVALSKDAIDMKIHERLMHNGRCLGIGFFVPILQTPSFHFEQIFDFRSDAVAYFFCVVPYPGTDLNLDYIKVQSSVWTPGLMKPDVTSMENMMDLLTGDEEATYIRFDNIFHFAFFQVVVKETLHRWKAGGKRDDDGDLIPPADIAPLLSFLGEEGFPPGIQAVECIVELLETIVQNERALARPPPTQNDAERMHAAMEGIL